MFKKTISAISKTWDWLDGKKRRIAFVAGLVMNAAKPNSLTGLIAQIVFYTFGGADLVRSTPKAVNKLYEKLPAGLKQ